MTRVKMLALSTAMALTLPAVARAADPADVVGTYADIAAAGYADSLSTARALQAAVDALIAAPSDETLKAARDAWLGAMLESIDEVGIPEPARSAMRAYFERGATFMMNQE